VHGKAEARLDPLDPLGGGGRGGLPQTPDHPLGVQPRGSRQHHGELVAAQPVGVVAAPESAPQRAREHPQGEVAGVVPERVVHGLQVVHVAEDQGKRAAGALARLDLLRDATQERPPIRERRERIVGRLVAEPYDLVGGVERGHGLVREEPQRLHPRPGGQQAIARVVDPDEADPAPLGLGQRDEQPVAVPGVGTASVHLRLARHAL
jgi:hypothetical protein